jgi:hypothetical protein
MRTFGNLAGVLLALLGIIWLLQDNFIIPGSFLAYEVHVLHRGIYAVAVGLLLVFFANSGSR